MTATNGTNGAIRHVGSGAAVVPSEVRRKSWTPAVEPVVRPPRIAQGTAHNPAIARRRSRGLRVRLLIVDVAATAGTWLFLGTINMPATTAGRRWGAALAATIVTLAAMQVLGLYRSRVCPRHGQELTRVVVAVLVGTVTLELLRGDGIRSYAAAITAAGVCILALMTLRWVFGLWLRSQRALGRYLRGLVMIGTERKRRFRVDHAAVGARTRLRSAGDHRQAPTQFELGGSSQRQRNRPTSRYRQTD